MINTVQTSDDMLKAEDAIKIANQAILERKMKLDQNIEERHNSGLYNYIHLIIKNFASKGLFELIYEVSEDEFFKYRYLIMDFNHLDYVVKVNLISNPHCTLKKYTISWRHDTTSSTL